VQGREDTLSRDGDLLAQFDWGGTVIDTERDQGHGNNAVDTNGKF
jgi:hypothetical protein